MEGNAFLMGIERESGKRQAVSHHALIAKQLIEFGMVAMLCGVSCGILLII